MNATIATQSDSTARLTLLDSFYSLIHQLILAACFYSELDFLRSFRNPILFFKRVTVARHSQWSRGPWLAAGRGRSLAPLPLRRSLASQPLRTGSKAPSDV